MIGDIILIFLILGIPWKICPYIKNSILVGGCSFTIKCHHLKIENNWFLWVKIIILGCIIFHEIGHIINHVQPWFLGVNILMNHALWSICFWWHTAKCTFWWWKPLFVWFLVASLETDTYTLFSFSIIHSVDTNF